MLMKCRTCLKEEHSLVDLFKIYKSMSLTAQILSLAEIDIHINDNLPRAICKKCLRKLKQCIAFISLCKKSDLQLRSNEIKNDHEKNFHSSSNKDGCKTKFGKIFFINTTIDINSKEDDINNGILEVAPSRKVFINESNDLDNRDIFSVDDHNNASIFETEEYKEDEKNVLVSRIDKGVKTELDDKLYIRENGELSYSKKKYIKKGNSKHQCPVCGKITSSGFRLKTHLATHSEERPFACKYCNRMFSINENLKVHLRTHTGEKPFKCTVCGEKFAHSAGLATHRRKHTGQTPYKCNICPRSFRTYTSMQYHNRLHADDRNFECGICSRAFITRGNLQLHLSTHSGEKPHLCPLCGTGFARVSNLKRHLQFVHKKENTKEFLKSRDKPCKNFLDKLDIKKEIK